MRNTLIANRPGYEKMISSVSAAAGSPSNAACTSVASVVRSAGSVPRNSCTIASAVVSQFGHGFPRRVARWRIALFTCSYSLS